MWKRVKVDLDSGIEKVKWFSSLLNDRVKIEISLFKLLFKASEIERKKTKLLEAMGRRVYELREGSGKNLIRDQVILDTLSQLDALDTEITEVRKKTEEIDRIEA